MRFYEPVWEYEGYELVRRPDTSNYYIYHTVSGRPTRRISTRTSELALARQRLVEYAETRRLPRKPHPSQVPLMEVLRGYVLTQLHGKTQRDCQGVLRLWAAFLQDQAISAVEEITPAMQRQYVLWRQDHAVVDRVLSTATINKDLAVLRAALNFWKKEGLVSEVPHVTLLSKPPPRDRFLRPDEVAALLQECAEPHLRRFVIISLHTLQRPGAILDLTVEQVDLQRRRIDFCPPGWRQSNKRRPVVPITQTLRPVLEEAIEESESGYIIEHQARPIDRISGAFRRACKRAGLHDVTPYTLRHTGGTLLAAAGVPLWQISGMMGHSLTRTTEIYAKHAPDFLQEAADGIERVFGTIELCAPNACQIPLIAATRKSKFFEESMVPLERLELPTH